MLERLKMPSWQIRARNLVARGWPAILRGGEVKSVDLLVVEDVISSCGIVMLKSMSMERDGGSHTN